jgi:hypothetical protein
MTGTAVARRPFNQAEFADKVMVDRVSLQMSETLEFDEFIRLGRSLTEVGDSLAWWVGDAIEQATVIYGGKYEAALEVMALEEQTLRVYALVCRRFAEPSRRRERLSFTHHQYVASLDPAEADRWLDRAEAEAWSAHELREQVRASRVEAPQHDTVTRVTLEQLKVTIPQDRADRWREAADRAGITVEEAVATAVDEWAARTLDTAAA